MATMIVDEQTGFIGYAPTLAGEIADALGCYLDEAREIAAGIVKARAAMCHLANASEMRGDETGAESTRALIRLFDADIRARFGTGIMWSVIGESLTA